MSEIRSYEQFKKNKNINSEYASSDKNKILFLNKLYVYFFPKCADVQQCFNEDYELLNKEDKTYKSPLTRKHLKTLFNKNAHAESTNVDLKTCFGGDTFHRVLLTMFMRNKNIDQYTEDEIPNWQTLLSKMQIVKTNMMGGEKLQSGSSGREEFDKFVEKMYSKVKVFLKPGKEKKSMFSFSRDVGPITTFAKYLESKKIKEGERTDILLINGTGFKKDDNGKFIELQKPEDISELAEATAWGMRDIGDINYFRHKKILCRPTNWQAIDAAKLKYAKEFPNNSDVKELSSYKDFEELFSTEEEEEEETAEVEDIKLEEEKEKIPTAEPVTGTETATATKVETEEGEKTEEGGTEEEAPAPVQEQVPAAKTGTGSSTKVNFNLGSSSIAQATGYRNPISSGGIVSGIIEFLKIFAPKFGGKKSRRRNKKTRKSRKQQKSRRANKK